MYYPKSQIKTNLYTNGGEFVILGTTQEYSGSYWKTSAGKYFTGVSPDDRPYKELTIIKPQPQSTESNQVETVELSEDVKNYSLAKKVDLNNIPIVKVPLYYLPSPSTEDYTLGSFTRYLCKRSNQNIYIEINKDTFDKLTSKSIEYDFSLYSPFKLTWTIKGDSISTVANINKSVVLTTERQLKITGLKEYFKNYSQFYQVG